VCERRDRSAAVAVGLKKVLNLVNLKRNAFVASDGEWQSYNKDVVFQSFQRPKIPPAEKLVRQLFQTNNKKKRTTNSFYFLSNFWKILYVSEENQVKPRRLKKKKKLKQVKSDERKCRKLCQKI